jgi:hypothetical protein
MKTSSSESSTTSHAAMHWGACYEDKCPVHLGEKDGANYYPKPPRRQQRPRKAKTVRWGDAPEEPKIHHEVGQFVVELQEEMLRMADEIGRLKQENREMKKRVVMAEESARKERVEARKLAKGRYDLWKRIQAIADETAKLAKDTKEGETTNDDLSNAAEKINGW